MDVTKFTMKCFVEGLKKWLNEVPCMDAQGRDDDINKMAFTEVP